MHSRAAARRHGDIARLSASVAGTTGARRSCRVRKRCEVERRRARRCSSAPSGGGEPTAFPMGSRLTRPGWKRNQRREGLRLLERSHGWDPAPATPDGPRPHPDAPCGPANFLLLQRFDRTGTVGTQKCTPIRPRPLLRSPAGRELAPGGRRCGRRAWLAARSPARSTPHRRAASATGPRITWRRAMPTRPCAP